ncbi:MAG: hypothetical protein ABIQ61_08765 [Ornithinibacter sp.]
MTSTTRHLLSLAAIVALAGVPATAAAADHGPVVRASGPLVDLQPASAGPFDGARASVQIVASAHGSHTVLRVTGIDPAVGGQTFGAHLHVGPCVAGNGAAAGAHYNTDVIAGALPVEISAATEVWLDLSVDGGAATSTASVPFVPLPGTRAVVIHALPTDGTGAAGARLACLPVVW